jgi:HemY protein
MRWIFWLLGLFALAVGAALFLTYNVGYALLVLPPYRVELSLNLLALLLIAAVALGYLLLRFVAVVVNLPAAAQEYHQRQRREKARQSLVNAMHAFLQGRFGKAERAAAKALELGEAPAVGAALAARAAHELRRFSERDGYLARGEGLSPEDATIRAMTAAELLLEERRPDDALAALNALPEKHTGALRLELKAHQLAGNWEQAVALIDQLERRGAFDAEQAGQIRRYSYAENLKRRWLDRGALEECWNRIPAKAQRDAKIAAPAARSYLVVGDCAAAARIIENSLAEAWDSELAGLYAECLGGDVVGRIERAEAWLKAHPHDAVLLYTLGRLCAHQGLWGKAQNYLEASISVEPSYSAHLALADLHERLGALEAAQRHYRASLDLAIAQLKQTGGGRRRTPL